LTIAANLAMATEQNCNQLQYGYIIVIVRFNVQLLVIVTVTQTCLIALQLWYII